MIYLILSVFLYLWLFYGAFALVMGLYRSYLNGTMTWFTKTLAAPYLVVGVLMDVIANFLLGTIIFLMPPKEWLVTQRLSKLKADPGWRGKLANWVCQNLLDPLDPSGEHCK
jgi:hypothetical protein